MKKIFVLFILNCLSFTFYGQGGFFTQGEGGVYTAERLAILKGPHGETGGIGNNPSMLNLYSDMRIRFGDLGEEVSLSLDDIEGSIYLQDDFTLGVLYDKEEPFKKLYLRFDAYSDEVQLKHYKESQKIEALLKSQNLSCVIGGERFIYTTYKGVDGNQEKGYLIALHIGDDYSLYIKREKIFKEGKKAKTSLQNSFPHRFQDNSEFYFAYGDMEPVFFKPKKKEVLSLFDQSDDIRIKKYAKENRVDFRSIDDLINLFKYMNSLKKPM